MRLLVWGREWGVEEGKLEKYLGEESKAGNERLRGLAIQVLSELYKTITDLDKLKGRYGLRDVDNVAPQQQKGALEGKGGNGNGNGNKTKDKPAPGEAWKESFKDKSFAERFKSELHLRAKWVIADKDKFHFFLTDLKDYNDGLEQLFPPSRLATLHRTWQNELLQGAQRDLAKLGLLESASNGVYPQLTTTANLKQLRINLDSKSTASFKPTFALKIQRPLLEVTDKEPRRSLSAYNSPSGPRGKNVVIEWVDYDKEDFEGRFQHIRRIDDLARMVHSASARHPDLHTIDCLGYTDDTDQSRFGVVYDSPASSFSTLYSIIASNDHRTPDLGDRFKLAHSLAVSLWSFHSLDWLHKSVCSTNILFFPSAVSDSASKPTVNAALVPDISSPVLLGFDSSRPDQVVEMSVASRNPSSLDLHRHPSSLEGIDRKPYCKGFDIYSLGLVLLEIGLWKILQAYYKPHYSAQRFRDRVVVGLLVPGLGSKTGSVYRQVVERCLEAKEDMTGLECHQLMEWVVGTLESLRV
ncbi:hypothetical protein V492_04071 [Pseudogymnoascus sp. VKM F-4246]|nr:hypothetical protein V492_04071 [Pseudogymnoascus sp. VKM F-4246]